MPDAVLPFLLFPVIGALIGALTNQLAIRMLFRPYRAWHVWGAKLPLTPGVIPSQRERIAANIASTFEKNLLSGREIHGLITGEKTRAAIERKVDEMLAELGPFAAFAQGMKPKIVAKILAGIEELATQSLEKSGELDIRAKLEARINAMDIEVLEELILGFSRQQFRAITVFGGLIGALIGVVQASLTLVL